MGAVASLNSMSERMIKCDQSKIELTSVYFSHSGYADMHIEKMFKKNIEPHCNNKNTSEALRETSTLCLGLGKTLNETALENSQRDNPTKRGIWMQQWLMIQKYVAFSSTFKKHQRNNTPSDPREREAAGLRGN